MNYDKIRKLLLRWYDDDTIEMPWRGETDPYKIWLSEIMLQQTQIKTVVSYYNEWISKFPTIKDVANSTQDEILNVWQGLGYYSRAINFYLSCKSLKNNNYKVPNNVSEFIKLRGVGPYIAHAVMSIAFNLPFAVVDANVNRFVSRFNAYDKEPLKNKEQIQSFVNKVIDINRPGDFNQAIMDFGRNVCKAQSPDCSVCPLNMDCIAKKNNLVNFIPTKTKRKIKPHYNVAVGIIWDKNKILITKRKNNGLLGGLWEFPGGKIENNENEFEAVKREIKEELSIEIDTQILLDKISHEYSHFSVCISAIKCQYIRGKVQLNGPCDYMWIKPQKIDNFPFPKSSTKLFHTLGV